MKKSILLYLLLPALMIHSLPGFSKSASVPGSEQTFVLSNEAPGYLITHLVNAGYGGYNLYDAMVAIQGDTNPEVSDILTDNFLNALATQPASSQIFTIQLKEENIPGTSVAISTDGMVQTVSIFGGTYFRQSGTATKVVDISGVGTGAFTHSATTAPLTSWDAGGNTYNVFAIGWGMAAPSITTQPANRTVNSGSSASFTVAASGAPATFTYKWQRLPHGGVTWSDLTEGGSYSGTATTTLTVHNTTLAMSGDQFRCTVSNGVSPDAVSNAAILTMSGINVNFNHDSFVLSNEGPGYLITELVNAGYGDDNLYQALVDITASTNPSIAGIITPAYLQALSSSPGMAEIFTTKLKSVNTPGISVAVSTDGTANIPSIFGSTFYGQTSIVTLASNIAGVGTCNFTHSQSSSSYLTSWTVDGPLAGMTTTYNVFAIGWSNSTDGIPISAINPETPDVYPNPFTDGFFVRNLQGPARIELFDMMGQLVFQAVREGNGFISPGVLPGGVYWIRITAGHSLALQKIIRQ